MLKRADSKLLATIKRLSNTTDFQIYCEWLKESLLDADKNNRVYENLVQVHRGQGTSLTLNAILDVVQEAKTQ